MSENLRRTLEVRFLDLWHVGCGRGEGHHLDAAVLRDAGGLPFVPGRMLRGLLRDAVECLVAWNHEAPGRVEHLFGGEVPRSDAPGRSLSRPGRLAVSDARLPPAESELLGGECGDATLRAALFVAQYQTRIDPLRGSAAAGSLRAVELVVPLTLQAEFALLLPDDSAADWATLDLALPLVRAVGAMKTRGHGRAVLTWSDEVPA